MLNFRYSEIFLKDTKIFENDLKEVMRTQEENDKIL